MTLSGTAGRRGQPLIAIIVVISAWTGMRIASQGDWTTSPTGRARHK